MADKKLKTITFPGLSDRYTIPQDGTDLNVDDTATTPQTIAAALTSQSAQITNLNTDVTHIKDMTSAAEQAGTYAEYHLGFYLDENGDLCQLEED